MDIGYSLQLILLSKTGVGRQYWLEIIDNYF